MTKIYIGNLSPSTTREEIRQLFEPYGKVDSVDLITDRYSGESRGFGFVEIESKEAARKAIAALNKQEVGGRNIKVNEAKPREVSGRQSGPQPRNRWGRRGY